MSADLKEIMSLTARRGPAGGLWFEGQRNGRKFAIFERRDGSWSMFERVGHPELAASPEPGARPSAPPRPASRPAPKRVRRELTRLGLVEAGERVEAGR